MVRTNSRGAIEVETFGLRAVESQRRTTADDFQFPAREKGAVAGIGREIVPSFEYRSD